MRTIIYIWLYFHVSIYICNNKVNELLIIIKVYYRDRHSAIWVGKYFLKEILTMPVFAIANEFCNFIASTTATSWPSNTWKWLVDKFIHIIKHLQRFLKRDFERTVTVYLIFTLSVSKKWVKRTTYEIKSPNLIFFFFLTGSWVFFI